MKTLLLILASTMPLTLCSERTYTGEGVSVRAPFNAPRLRQVYELILTGDLDRIAYAQGYLYEVEMEGAPCS